jgi:hypothetical protein
MHARRSTLLAIACLTFCGVSATDAASPARCAAVASSADSSTDEQALRTAITRPVALADDDEGLYDRHRTDRYALDEMLRGTNETALRWDRVPELVVLLPVMQYEKSQGTQYRATAERLTGEEAAQLVADLTTALAVLTDNAFRGFAAVRHETVAAGEVVNVMRPGQIVVARYNGVRDQLATIGFGGRSTRGSTIRAGSIILDSAFDRTSDTRRLLRMHELGHALGYNHVQSRASIMNPKIGSEVTSFDRSAARIAFQSFQPASSCS